MTVSTCGDVSIHLTLSRDWGSELRGVCDERTPDRHPWVARTLEEPWEPIQDTLVSVCRYVHLQSIALFIVIS